MCVIIHMSVITQDGVSVLMKAAREGKTEVVVELVKAGANMDVQTKVRQYVTHDVNVQNHTSTLNSPLSVTHSYTCYVHVKWTFAYPYPPIQLFRLSEFILLQSHARARRHDFANVYAQPLHYIYIHVHVHATDMYCMCGEYDVSLQ